MGVDRKQLEILLVSSSQPCIDLVRRAYLENSGGANLSIARCLNDARQYLKRALPDVVIADSVLPDGRGIDLVNDGPEPGLFPLLLLADGGEPAESRDWPVTGVELISRADHALGAMPRIVMRIREKWRLAVQHRRARLQEAILSERLNALAVGATCIAHDFNNVLHAIAGNIALAKEDQAGRPDTLVLLEQAQKAVERAEQIVRRLYDLACGTSRSGGTADAAAVIAESTRHAVMGSAIALSLSVPDDLPAVGIDEGQLYRVMNNTLTNAVEAMPDGGEPSISCRVETVAEETGDLPPPGVYLVITIRDTGTGIPATQQCRIFEPYFTTKKDGTGMGLASVAGILSQCRGHVSVDSRPGLGSAFTVYVPVAKGAADRVSAGSEVHQEQ